MTRGLAFALRVASVPVGVGVGLWMAQLTRTPQCPGRGLGLRDFCVARPLFEPSLCVLCGGTAALGLLLVSVAVRRAPRVAIFDLAAAEAGIVIGAWASLTTYACGLDQLCIGFLAQRFAAWESAIFGAAATIVLLVVGAAVNADVRRVNLGVARGVQRWLFEDLSRVAPAGGPGSDAG